MVTQHEIIGEEWATRAGDLADWAMDHLVNRKDVWGQYSVLTPTERRREGKSYKAMTLPKKEMRGSDMVTIDKLTRHFASRHHRKPQLIGLHAKSKDSTSKWFGIDIDMHDATKTGAEDHARRNLNCAIKWWRELQDLGYDPMLFDTNNFGGFHIWVMFDQPAPTTDVFAFVKSIVTKWQQDGLDEEPETFPKKPKDGSIGAWFRLPGLHHTKYHYASVWSGDDWLDDPWLTGHAAIDSILSNQPGPPPPKVDLDEAALSRSRVVPSRRKQQTPSAAAPKRKFKRKGRAKVCVDLDGVLASKLAPFKKTQIGPPIDGVVEFLRDLNEFADITILTSRLSTGTDEEQEELRQVIEAWLNDNNLPFKNIYTGPGKPMAHAYIDDRAVACRPVEQGLAAFTQAMDDARELCD